MATKLQQLLDELKGLKRHHLILDMEGEANTMECKTGDLVDWADIDSLIAKYTETTPTYKPGDSVRVIDCIHNHGFKIGSIITLMYYSNIGQDWVGENEEKSWRLTEEEFEPIIII